MAVVDPAQARGAYTPIKKHSAKTDKPTVCIEQGCTGNICIYCKR